MLRKTPLKRSRRKEPTALEKRHINRVATLGCLVSGRPATIHHVTGYADRMGRLPRSHQRIVPLAPEYHQAVFDSASMPVSVERLGHRGFFQEHGIDLLAEAERLWAETLEIEARRRKAA
jgi:hypothetical protein